jgi:hypothetical protein
MTNQINSRKATIQNLTQALELAAQIASKLENELAETECPASDIHWGHAGSAGYTVEELAEIRDRLYGIGEYAEEA